VVPPGNAIFGRFDLAFSSNFISGDFSKRRVFDPKMGGTPKMTKNAIFHVFDHF
jgi:hypothetical protein